MSSIPPIVFSIADHAAALPLLGKNMAVSSSRSFPWTVASGARFVNEKLPHATMRHYGPAARNGIVFSEYGCSGSVESERLLTLRHADGLHTLHDVIFYYRV
jgi:hypothetical protein